MAKKKGAPPSPKPNALVIRGSAEWREWLKGAADVERTSVAEFVDRATAAYARQIGIKEVAPKR